MITKLLNEVNEKIETLNNLVQDKEYFVKLDERIEKVNNYVQEQQQENEKLHSIIKEVREYIEEKYEMELKDSMVDFLDHDELVDRKRLLHILEILDKEK